MRDIFERIIAKLKSSPEDFTVFEEPIRAEIFSPSRLETQAESLSQTHVIYESPKKGFRLSRQISHNQRILEKSYQHILAAVAEHRAITPAGEWLIDNFHIVRAQLKDIRDHLPPEYYRELPKLSEGPLKDYPRVYGIAHFFVAHTDSHFDADSLKRFLMAYQKHQPLTIGELWAVPITLRVVLLDNLRRLAERIVGSQQARLLGDKISDEILGLGERPPRPMDEIIADLEQSPFSVWLAVQLLQRLRLQDLKVEPILKWLEQRLERDSLTPEAAVDLEHSRQTGANATVRNIITSARLISSFNWPDFFEEVSLVDATLRKNPLYQKLDFATRDRYRHTLEHLGRSSPLSQIEIAEKIIDLTKAPQNVDNPRFSEIGYYLISDGRQILEKEILFQASFKENVGRSYLASGTEIYLGGIVFFSFLILSLPLMVTQDLLENRLHTYLFLLLGLLAASEIAVALVNRLTIALLGPKHLPRIDVEQGIPPEFKTIVVVPTFLSRAEAIDAQLEELEIHYLSNPHGHLYFALLTDWVDAKTETLPNDPLLLQMASEKLKSLNAKYPPAPDGLPRFFIFHRKRLYNPQEEKWIAWERKRGKLHELNRLLMGFRDTTHIPLPGSQIAVPHGVRYVITLDADTKMPKGSVAQLIGTIAHPLNEAYFDPKKGRVTEGYGILQPRITPTLPGLHEGTIFQKLSSGPSGVDPYASAVSDVYQDLFNEGTFMGKGIYNIKIFMRALENRIPENTLLSHDLLEGNCARCGFLSDVEFFEDFPAHALVAAQRSHRWIRGDWQLIPWIFGRNGDSISIIGRWKMIDNLRRSLVAPALFLLFVFSFILPLSLAWAWLLFAAVTLAIPALVTFIADLQSKKRSVHLQAHLRFSLEDFYQGLQRTGMALVLLPHHSWISVDAIARAIYRLFISKKHRLEWTTSAQAMATASLDIGSFFFDMRGALLLTSLGAFFVSLFSSWGLLSGAALFLIWWLSPFFAQYISRPTEIEELKPMSGAQSETLRLTARRIWHFFSTFVKADDHYLPPDNFQEEPHPVIAHRSSPTNFGIYLLSIFSAKRFGWIGVQEAIQRLDQTLNSLNGLPKYNGHFYNWYETTEPRALDPKYISSVDNGNLAGHLIAAAQGINYLLETKYDIAELMRGSHDTLVLLHKSLLSHFNKKKTLSYEEKKLLELIHQLGFDLHHGDDMEIESLRWASLKKQATDIHHLIRGLFKSEQHQEILSWNQSLQNELTAADSEYNDFLAWTEFSKKMLPAIEDEGIKKIWVTIQKELAEKISLERIPQHCQHLIGLISDFKKRNSNLPAETQTFLSFLLDRLEVSVKNAEALIDKAEAAKAIAYRLFNDMDFRLLYDSTRKLFSIGLRVFEKMLDPSYYDLLASEARLLSFIAVAKGDVPVSHWFCLGRNLTRVKNGSLLVSWSGSMFEYLMPSLVMNTPQGGLVKETCEISIQRQIDYGNERSVPWGISESAYNKRDLHQTYQYSNFGVPDLALKRGLGEDLVVAPYATCLAAMYEPALAAENLSRLHALGASGMFGFYEAIDFTPSRVPTNRTFSVVKAYMTHHQGMSLASITNVFYDGFLRELFHSEPLVQATEILLQERTPRAVDALPAVDNQILPLLREDLGDVSRRYYSVNRPTPRTQILSNGNYSVMLSSGGSGYSHFQNFAVTRWREDVTQDHWGSYFFLKDLNSLKVWSPTYQPTATTADNYEVTLAEDRVFFRRVENQIASILDVFVSPEHNAEIRQLTLTNEGDSPRDIEVTSYAEIVLNTQNADIAHPTFSNLFVQTEYNPETQALIAHRRPRSSKDRTLWAAHAITLNGSQQSGIEYETDRAQFIGRGRNIHNPQAIFSNKKLTNTTGAVLDPIFSLRTRFHLEPGVSVNIFFSTMVAETREELTLLTESFHEISTFERASSLAWSQTQIKLHYLNIGPEEAHLFQRLATRLLFLDATLRASTTILKRNNKDVTHLWPYGISGDYPIIVVRIEEPEDRGIIRQLLKAQEYLALKRMVVDLVILNARAVSYAQELQHLLESMAHAGSNPPAELPQSRGKIFVLREDLLPREDRLAILSEARVVLSARQGTLADQVNRMLHAPVIPSAITQAPRMNTAPVLPTPTLEFFNGLGGFTPDGREYVIVLNNSSQNTPAPWINVISNGYFGFQVSESGSGYTWCGNSRENQITPWSNDPICDPPGEAFYIYDHDDHFLWSPTALPIRIEEASYICRHGQGYSRFEHLSHEIQSTLTQFLIPDRPIKYSNLRLENRSSRTRSISLYAYIEWVLGFSRATMAPYTITEIDEITGTLLAFNRRNSEYGQKISFAGFLNHPQFVTGDRREFIGRNRTLTSPIGILRDEPLSNHVGAALDPCGAFQTEIRLGPGEVAEIPFVLGQADHRIQAREWILQLRHQSFDSLFDKVTQQWDSLLDKIQVRTPDKSIDFLLNRWLIYQNITCRYWARSAFYQAGGAYGFRDQLQDMMSITFTEPQMVRSHLLLAASRQYLEGDVQHWWHPPKGRGVRTHFSDDLLWLPFVTFHYLDVTKDTTVLDERVSFLEGPPLRPDQEDSYYTPAVSTQSASLYEHCARAIDRSLGTGVHGLPLIGCGDWNDGMNRVGKEGKGESVWLGWFLYLNLVQFAPIADERGENERAEKWRLHATQLKAALEREAWDGDWYRRAFYDDGSPLGSVSNEECRIDSLAQTWAVISGAADPARARHAMHALENFLVLPEDKLVLLFTPPFDKTPKDPGYIKGYVPGVRENGGQYTHAAAWCVIAWALLGEGQRAIEIFNLVNPINHGRDPDSVAHYKIEPYVVAGDVYSQEPHKGRGGWSWYTGSAGWLYRAVLEYILGFKIRGPELFLNPQISPEWKFFEIRFTFQSSHYDLEVQNPKGFSAGIEKIELDGSPIEISKPVSLQDDGKNHKILVILGGPHARR